ncbi:hypothetical protein ACN6MT_10315 [Neobacillus niacini]|uniref:hypothetical protein n=1 Tax=Neobacillus niacini TaxID=86668 RepID=UPI003B02588A
MNKRSLILYFSVLMSVTAILFLYNNEVNNKYEQEDKVVARAVNVQTEYVNVDEFGANGEDSKDDSQSIQAAIDYSYDSKIGKVKLLGNKKYILKQGLVLKAGVELEFGQNTRLRIDGNFRAIDVKKNASILNGVLEIVNPNFSSDAIYIDGDQKIWSWDRTQIKNVTIVNAAGSNKGTGIHLYAGESGHFISFINFIDIRIAGFHTGVKLEAVKPKDKDKYSFINGNRFINLTLDDCIRGIDIISSITIPNESSGNEFSGLQIQVSKHTKEVITVNGSDNKFEGMIWDVHLLKDNKSIIEFSKDSMRNSLFSNIGSAYIRDKGKNNYYSSPEEEAKNNR